jgi:hypothetical protein
LREQLAHLLKLLVQQQQQAVVAVGHAEQYLQQHQVQVDQVAAVAVGKQQALARQLLHQDKVMLAVTQHPMDWLETAVVAAVLTQ